MKSCIYFFSLVVMLSANLSAQPSILYRDTIPNYRAFGLFNRPGGGYIVAGPSFTGIDLLHFDEKLHPDTTLYSGMFQYNMATLRADDGSYLFAGYVPTDSQADDLHLLKLHPNGRLAWHTQNSTFNGDYAKAICEVPGGGWVTVGASRFGSRVTGGPYGALATRFDASGRIIWEQTYPWSKEGFGIFPHPEGGFVILGHSFGKPGTPRKSLLCFIRTDSVGSLLEFIEPGTFGVDPLNATATIDGNYFALGKRTGSTKPGRPILQKIDPQGNLLWQRTYAHHADSLNPSLLPQPTPIIRATPDGGCIIAGKFSLGISAARTIGFYLLKVDSLGNMEWDYLWGGGGDTYGTTFNVLPTPDGGYLTAYTTNDSLTANLVLTRFAFASSASAPPVVAGLRIAPNPATSQLALLSEQPLPQGQLRLMDMQGRLLMQRPLEAGATRMELPIEGLPAAAYILAVQAGQLTQHFRVLKQ